MNEKTLFEKQQTATFYVKNSNEWKDNLQIAHSEPETKSKVQKIQIRILDPKGKNLGSGWLQTLLYQESTTWSKNRGVNLMKPQNVAYNTCRGTRRGFP